MAGRERGGGREREGGRERGREREGEESYITDMLSTRRNGPHMKVYIY